MFKLNKFTPLLLLLAVIILIVPVFSGCGGEEASNTFIELFHLVPAAAVVTEPFYFITFTDMASYYRDIDITFSSFEELMEKYNPDDVKFFVGGYAYITGWGGQADTSTIQNQYMGYNISNVDAEILFGSTPFAAVAAIGRFDPQATKNALQNQAEWPDWAVADYSTEEYQGVTIHSWGDGYQIHMTTRLMPPHIDRLGRAMPLAVTDSHLFYAPTLEAVRIMIDASQNQFTSLADLPEFAAIANGLAELKAYTAMAGDASLANGLLSRPNTQLTDEEKAEAIKNAGVQLKKFITFGSGLGYDEKGIYTAIVLYHENSADAQANVSILKQHIENDSSTFTDEKWSDIITGTDIWAEGNTLMARLYHDSPGLWQSWAYTWDTLLFHEE